EMIQWGEAALQALIHDDDTRAQAQAWEAHLRAYLAAASGIGGIGDELHRHSNRDAQDTQDIQDEDRAITGSHPVHPVNPVHPCELSVARAITPLEPDWRPRRDARFESYNYNFPPHWVYAQRERPADERMLALVCKRLLEMDVPEMMAAIIWRAREAALAAGNPKPWDYTVEMCRQVWDEARHSMMGEAWLAHRGDRK